MRQRTRPFIGTRSSTVSRRTSRPPVLMASMALVLALQLAMPATLSAQEGAEEPETHLPADSLEIGAKYVDWLLDYRADSLWAHFSDRMRENFGSKGEFLDGMGEVFRQIGEQDRMLDQRFWTRSGKSQFWHTAEFSQVPEPIVIRMVIEPDGTISGMGMNPQSQNPPVDDPNQHGEVDAEEEGSNS